MADTKKIDLLSDTHSEQVRTLDKEGHACNRDLIVLRDINLQKDPARFRRALRNIGYDIGRELTQEFILEDRCRTVVPTPLGCAEQQMYAREPILLTVIRAGIPMYEGMQEAFPDAKAGFVAASRVEGSLREDGTMDVRVEYRGVPDFQGQRLIIVDPMLATASSIVSIHSQLVGTHGMPSKTYIAAAISAPEGIARIEREMQNARIITASLDTRLNEKGYIIPGLGDAGDLCFGKKGENNE